jgi:hypothetical protein
MTANASSATRNAVGNSLTSLLNVPVAWREPVDAVEGRVTALASVPRWSAGAFASATLPGLLGAVCDAAPARCAFPLVALPLARRARLEAPRGVRDVDRVPDADVPCTDGADDPEVPLPDPVDGDDDPRPGGETGDRTVGGWTGGIDGVLTDGVVMLGVVIFGVVTGPVVTDGTVTDGTLTVGTETVGIDTVGIDTVGIDTVGTDTVGNPAAEALPAAAAVEAPAETSSAPDTTNAVSRRELISRLAACLHTTYEQTRASRLSANRAPVLFYSPGKPADLSL